MHVPAGVLSDMFGAKHAFSHGLLLGAIASALHPWAIKHGGFTALYILRVFIGMSQVTLVQHLL